MAQETRRAGTEVGVGKMTLEEIKGKVLREVADMAPQMAIPMALQTEMVTPNPGGHKLAREALVKLIFHSSPRFILKKAKTNHP